MDHEQFDESGSYLDILLQAAWSQELVEHAVNAWKLWLIKKRMDFQHFEGSIPIKSNDFRTVTMNSRSAMRKYYRSYAGFIDTCLHQAIDDAEAKRQAKSIFKTWLKTNPGSPGDLKLFVDYYKNHIDALLEKQPVDYEDDSSADEEDSSDLAMVNKGYNELLNSSEETVEHQARSQDRSVRFFDQHLSGLMQQRYEKMHEPESVPAETFNQPNPGYIP